jgi:Bacterial SH3 domain
MQVKLQGFFLLALLALALGAAAAEAREGTTTTALALRTAPSPKAQALLTMPAGARVDIGACSRGWCRVAWSGTSGYARQGGLAVETGSQRVASGYVPVYPPYPYRAGHYPKADWYYDLPPYAAIVPSFYRKRFFMMAQERNRYRYMPHIFTGYNADEGIDYGGDVDFNYKSLTSINGE